MLYGAFVYTRDSAGHAALDARGQRQTLSLQPKAGGISKPAPGSIDGVVVLGMHRSGTSMVTGLLQDMGLHLGEPDDILGAKEGENDKGFFERLQVVVQNDKLMKEQDVNWSLNIFHFDHLLALVRKSIPCVKTKCAVRLISFPSSNSNLDMYPPLPV